MSTKNDFVPWGYYGTYGTVYMPDSVDLLDISKDIDGIDLKLIEKVH